MKDLHGNIENFTYEEIQRLMEEIEDWYASAFPELDVIYLAVPKKDSQRRKRIFAKALEMIEREIE